MLERICQLKGFCYEISAANPDLNLSENEWTVLENHISLLEPLYAFTIKLQSEILFPGDFKISLIKIKNQLTNLSNIFPLAVKAITAIESQMNTYDTMDSFVLALYLDPRYNILLSQQARETAHTLITTYNYQHEESEVDTNSTTCEPQESTGNTIDEVEAILLQASSLKPVTLIPQNVHDRRTALKLELDQFEALPRLPHTANLLKWWEADTSFPNLRKIASSALAIPLTQVSVKRLYSLYLLILSTKRNSLSESHIEEDILFIKANSDLK